MAPTPSRTTACMKRPICSIPKPSRAAAHLRVGRLLAAQTPAETLDEAIFEIAGQLNRGAALITDPDERERLAELNLMAGQRAKASTAYASALAYLEHRRGVAGRRGGWANRHALRFALEQHRVECEFPDWASWISRTRAWRADGARHHHGRAGPGRLPPDGHLPGARPERPRGGGVPRIPAPCRHRMDCPRRTTTRSSANTTRSGPASGIAPSRT